MFFLRSEKGVTPGAERCAEDGKEGETHHVEREIETERGGREEATAARKHDRKRRIGRQAAAI